jgi:enamine deaminase RidA (YjgF/YER057c/UK114 family)
MLRGMPVDERLAELGIELPDPPGAVGSYAPVVVDGDLAWVSGQVPLIDGTMLHPGKVGADVAVDQAQEAARRCVLQALSALRAELGSLDRIARVVRVSVFVASAPGFGEQPAVANGASDLLVEILGPAGVHSRAAVGVAELPLGASVEVAMSVRVGDASLDGSGT